MPLQQNKTNIIIAKILLLNFLSLAIIIILQSFHPLRIDFLGNSYAEHIEIYKRNAVLFICFIFTLLIIILWSIFSKKSS